MPNSVEQNIAQIRETLVAIDIKLEYMAKEQDAIRQLVSAHEKRYHASPGGGSKILIGIISTLAVAIATLVASLFAGCEPVTFDPGYMTGAEICGVVGNCAESK